MKYKIGVVIYTYNRVDDARINMEIVREVWGKSKLFKSIKIVHTYNGEKEWYPKKYIEDVVVRTKNTGHFSGASKLIDIGISTLQKRYKKLDYVVVLAADTWVIRPLYIANTLKKMNKNREYIATCPWNSKTKKDPIWKLGQLATDMFVVDAVWAKKYKLFPFNYADFFKKYGELVEYQGKNVFLENIFYLRMMQAIRRAYKIPTENITRAVTDSYIHRMTEREPIHIIKKNKWKGRRLYNHAIGVVAYHAPQRKKTILKKSKLKLGRYGKKLVKSKRMDYYNRGLKKLQFVKEDKTVIVGIE